MILSSQSSVQLGMHVSIMWQSLSDHVAGVHLWPDSMCNLHFDFCLCIQKTFVSWASNVMVIGTLLRLC